MAEDPRQELEFVLGGKTFRARPSWEVLAAIEGSTNSPARTIGMKALASLQRAADRVTPEISLTEMAATLAALLRGQPGAPEPNKIGEMLVEDGYSQLLLPVGLFLTRAYKGNKEHEKDAAETARRAREAEEEARKNEEAPQTEAGPGPQTTTGSSG